MKKPTETCPSRWVELYLKMSASLDFPDYSTNAFIVHQWRRIPGHEDYLVCSDGRIASLKSGHMRILRGWYTHDGYRQYRIDDVRLYGHRIVAATFLGDPPPGDVVAHHRNHVRDCNLVSNLTWITRAENNRLRRDNSSNTI